ncbi:MAG: hypothetical protein HY929_02310 [Euryarchaeota archaeon]|nr:hypothetical protein [Euryarchaeota archaeon]
MYFLLNSKPKGPIDLALLKRVLTLLENPKIKFVCHYGYLNEPGGMHVVEVETIDELKTTLSQFLRTGEVTEVIPLTTHEETVNALKNMIKKFESK